MATGSGQGARSRAHAGGQQRWVAAPDGAQDGGGALLPTVGDDGLAAGAARFSPINPFIKKMSTIYHTHTIQITTQWIRTFRS